VIPEIKKWFDHESGVKLIPSTIMDQLTGANEYTVKVRSKIGDFTRPVCEVNCLTPEEPDTKAWADVMTGSLYVDGQCLSGALNFVGTPKATGKKVASWLTRQKKGALILATTNLVEIL